MYIPINVARPSGGSPGASAPKEPNVTIMAVDDILSWPERDSKGVKMLGSFVMKPGAKMITVYMTPSKTKPSYESEGEEDTITISQKFEGEHPGSSLEIDEFIANWIGVNAIIVSGSCSDNYRTVIGTKCAPVQLKPSSQDDNDARKKMLVFEQHAKSRFLPGYYTGALVYAQPYEAATAALDVNTDNGYQYRLPSLAVTAAVSFTTLELEHGDVITLIGSGGDDPATLASGTAGSVEVLLKAGTTWVGLQNAVINLQVFDNGGTKYLVELSRG